MPSLSHIPHLQKISDFYRQLRIGLPQGDDFAIMRIEDQPDTKLLEMPLFRCNFYRIVLFLNEGVHFTLPDKRLASGANSIYFSYPGKIESWRTEQDIKGYLICFTDAFAGFTTTHSGFGEQYPFFQFDASSLLCSDDQQLVPITGAIERMLSEAQSPGPDSSALLKLQLLTCLLLIKRIYQQQQNDLSSSARNNTAIYHRFRAAVETYFLALAEGTVDQQASVRLIADRLLLHPSYLNTVIKDVTGHTASHFIRAKTILEAKSYLQHTDLQIAEIAFRLGFTSVPYFNRFFKKTTKLTPTRFRSNL